MKVIIDIDKHYIIEKLETFLRHFVMIGYKWLTTEGEILGYILGVLHFMISTTIFILLIVSHTIYPAFWLQVTVFVLIVIIWIQHIMLKVCVSVVAEKKLTMNESPFHSILENMFHVDSETFSNYFVTAETAAIVCLGLELISRISIYLQRYLNNINI